jgi:cobalt/nickel transport system permease protein
MHISDGILSPGVLAAGFAISVGGTWLGLKKLDYEKVPSAAAVCAGFFVASLIHFPIGPANFHLVLNGLAGIILGWTVFPVILVALSLQFLFFNYGGILCLPVNTANMALPAILSYYIFRKFIILQGRRKNFRTALAAFFCGAFAIFASALMTSSSLFLSDPFYANAARIFFIANIPLMLIEGFATSVITVFLCETKPEIFLFFTGEKNAAIM